jgi:hypothetical protein
MEHEKQAEGGREIALVLTGTLPEISGNFEACRSWYLAELERYQGVVDPEKLPEAKADLTKLRAEVKRLDRIRIDESKRLKAPISAMEKQVESLTALISQTIDKIALQVKACEEKTRKLCEKLMLELLYAEYDRLEVRPEYRTGATMIEPMVGISKVTAGGALTKAARESIEGLAMQGRAAQDKADGRMARVEAECRAAGIEPFVREYLSSFLDADDAGFTHHLNRFLLMEKERVEAARKKQEEEIRRQERAKAQAEEAERARLEAISRKEHEERLARERAEREAKEEEAWKLEPHNREDNPQDQTATKTTANTPTIQPVAQEAPRTGEKINIIVSATFGVVTKKEYSLPGIAAWFEGQIRSNPMLAKELERVIAFAGPNQA